MRRYAPCHARVAGGESIASVRSTSGREQVVSLSRKDDPLSTLYRHCLFRSTERVEAHDHVSHELIEHSLHWKHGVPNAAMFKGELPRERKSVV